MSRVLLLANRKNSKIETNVIITVIVTVTMRSICSAKSYCDNNDTNREAYM